MKNSYTLYPLKTFQERPEQFSTIFLSTLMSFATKNVYSNFFFFGLVLPFYDNHVDGAIQQEYWKTSMMSMCYAQY